MNLVRKFIISLTIAFFAVCCGAVLLFNWSALGWKALTVPTGSMRPTIPPGSLVLMHRVPNQSLKVGDVITYANPLKPGTTITHRITKTYKLDGKIPAYITKGDANATPDQPVVGGQVLGKAVWYTPHIGTWLNWSKGWVGLAILIYAPALFIMFEEVQKLSSYYKTKRPYVLRHNWTIKRHRTHLTGTPARSAYLSVIMLFVATVVAFPVYALLASNTVALAPNNLTVAPIINPPPPGAHVTFKIITLRCSSDNTDTASVRPRIVIINWTHQNITTHHWQVADNSGAIINIPNGTVLKKLHQYTFTPLLANGLQYAGDRLNLLNDNGQIVDALSWGTDISAFNPAIPAVAVGSRLERHPFNKDTDTANDWRVTSHSCHCPFFPNQQAGDDSDDFGDLSELGRVTTPGTFNMQEN